MDFLDFPKLVYTKEDFKSLHDEKHLQEDDKWNEFLLTDDEYVDFSNRCENTLKPYKKDISSFYPLDFMESYDFPSLISWAYQVFGFEKEEDYLEHLLSLDENEIKRELLISMIKIEEKNLLNKSDAEEKADAILCSPSSIMDFIKDLPIDAATKWNLYLVMEAPKKYLNDYVALLYKLLPAFCTIYLAQEEKMIQYGTALEEYLNTQGEKGVEEVTCSIVNPQVLFHDMNHILISVMNPYSLVIVTTAKINYLSWGIKMQDAFKEWKKQQENKLSERVHIFKNLGDKTRYEVLRLIANGESSTKNIAALLSVSSATISYHINALVTSNIIKYEKRNSKIGYKVDWNLIEEAFHDLRKDLTQDTEETI